jgi:NAD(P)-dependent dehydrogenase (short-subunit alcohol dehydrogenase family)
MDELKGRTAVITGGASGIGLAMARRFAAEGVQLVLADVEEPVLERAVAELDGLGARVHGMASFLPLLLEQDQGHVVNTASLAGLGGVPGMGPYCASKSAVVGLSESLFFELAERSSKVGCSVLCPGFVNTEIYRSERNLPSHLAPLAEQESVRSMEDLTRQVVEAGLEPSVVAEQVLGAVLEDRFWILPHEKLALATMRRRLEWMQGGPPPGMGLEKVLENSISDRSPEAGDRDRSR